MIPSVTSIPARGANSWSCTYATCQGACSATGRRAACERYPLRSDCTTSKLGRQTLRHFDEEYVDRVKAYRRTFLYEKALRKQRMWVEPLFTEAKD